MKTLYASQLLWLVGLGLVRLSVLAFYARIFHVHTNPCRMWTAAYWIAVISSAIWTATVILLNIFACHPVDYFWNRSGDGHCISFDKLLLTSVLGSIIMDLMIVLIPIPQVLILNLSYRRKITVSMAFILAYRFEHLTEYAAWKTDFALIQYPIYVTWSPCSLSCIWKPHCSKSIL
jgi:hypothetical protein